MTKHGLFVSAGLSILFFTQSTGGTTNLANEIHAIVEIRQACLIGGVRNKRWVGADAFGKRLKGARKFSLYTLKGPAGEITTSKIAQDGNEPCPDFWSAETSSQTKEGIAIASPFWNVMPRLPRAVDPKDTTYVRIVSDILNGAGIKKPVMEITQAYKIDLDGDGKEEVVIAANHYGSGLRELTGIAGMIEAGDYSFVLVRKIISGKVQNIFITKEFFPKELGPGLARGNHISAIADLNGDGVMEIVLYSAYYEGSESYIIQIRGNKAITALDCSCDA